jgi:hypothetical protein
VIQKTFRFVAFFYALALTVASLQPGRPAGLHASGFHAPLHIICFGLLVVLAHLGLPGRRALLLLIPACALLGLSVEALQHWEFHEAMEWDDVAYDIIGTIVGSLLCLIRK